MTRLYTTPYLSDQPDGCMIRFICERCPNAPRRGQYRKETLLARFGDICMPELLSRMADCGRRNNFSTPCGLRFDSGAPDPAREAAAMLSESIPSSDNDDAWALVQWAKNNLQSDES